MSQLGSSVAPKQRGADVLRVSLFPDGRQPIDPDAIDWPIGIAPPDSDDRRPREQLRRRTLIMEDVLFEFICGPNRLDLHFYPKPPFTGMGGNSGVIGQGVIGQGVVGQGVVGAGVVAIPLPGASIPLIGSVEECSKRLIALATAVASAVPLIRAAVAPSMCYVFSAPEQAVEFISTRLPQLGLNASRHSDLIFQLNDRDKLKSVPLVENKITCWRTELGMVAQFGPGGAVFADQNAINLARLQLDFNNAPATAPMDKQVIPQLLEELRAHTVAAIA